MRTLYYTLAVFRALVGIILDLWDLWNQREDDP